MQICSVHDKKKIAKKVADGERERDRARERKSKSESRKKER